MAVRKEDVIRQASQEVKDSVSAAEKIIDPRLRNFFGTRIIIDIKDLKLVGNHDFQTRVINEIITIYRQNGWTVRKQSDQREGDWLEFN